MGTTVRYCTREFHVRCERERHMAVSMRTHASPCLPVGESDESPQSSAPRAEKPIHFMVMLLVLHTAGPGLLDNPTPCGPHHPWAHLASPNQRRPDGVQTAGRARLYIPRRKKLMATFLLRFSPPPYYCW